MHPTLRRSNFVLPTIPSFRPGSRPHTEWWKAEKRKCIEGYWHNGIWCPPQLYFYLNFWHIRVAVSVYSKAKKVLLPFFRVVEWEKAYYYNEAIGFSGFELDEEFTCHREVRDWKEGDEPLHEVIRASCTRPDGTLKTYLPCREYLRLTRETNLGKPLYFNRNQNFVDLESRGTGKSYWASCCIAHNWLFDGYTDYDQYFADRAKGEVQASETLVGAIDTKYSKGLLDKVQEGLKYLPGKYVQSFGDKERVHPSPFAKKYTGSFEPGESIKAQYKVKKSGLTLWQGSGSQILHRSFNDNHLAGNGSRPGRAFLEEVGFFGNLLASLGALKDCMSESGVPIGTVYMMGTGGDMVGGATEQVQAVFYEPEAYGCVVFQDEYENNPKPQGFFLPFYKADNEFLDRETGLIDEARSLAKCQKERIRLKSGKDVTAYNSELENRPLVPSEVFLVTSSNPFPVAELKEQLKLVETTTDSSLLGTLGTMTMISGKAEFVPDVDNELRMPDWPIKRGDNDKQKGRDVETKGAVCIFHHPNPAAGYGWYSAGYDPTRFTAEEAPTSVSLDSFWIIERAGLGNGLSHDRIVCEYTGRPDGEEFKETVQKLLYYYDASQRLSISCLYENNIRDFKAYLEKHNDLRYLAFSPNIIQTRKNASENEYGLNSANDKVKSEILGFLKNWLKKVVITSDEKGEKKLQLHYIYSKGLLKELISYNEEGNFDRVIALALAIINAEQLYKIEVTNQEEEKEDSLSSWFSRPMFKHRR